MRPKRQSKNQTQIWQREVKVSKIKLPLMEKVKCMQYMGDFSREMETLRNNVP